jgi:predicted porin
MKKSLFAIAAVTAFAGAAQAQSSVTVYGIVDVSYGQNYVDQGQVAASVKTTGLADSANASSRLGFRGVEDLGGGMQATFVLESGLNITGGTTFAKSNGQSTSAVTQSDAAVFGSATRQSFLTLGTKTLGTVLVGYKKLLESDFNDTFVYGTENTFGSEGQELNRVSRGNQISYTSPTFGGFTASIANTSQVNSYDLAATQTTSKANASVNQINLAYRAGNVVVMAHGGMGTVDNGSTATIATATTGLGAAGINAYNTAGIGASYDFGVARVAAMYGQRETGVLNSTEIDSKYSALSAAIPIGNNTLKATYSMSESKNKNGNTTAKNGGFQLLGEHNLSKRTMLWAIYGYNKTDAVIAADAVTNKSAAVTAANEVKSSSMRIGMTHSF